jgi:hypothetical protein
VKDKHLKRTVRVSLAGRERGEAPLEAALAHFVLIGDRLKS